MLEYISNARTLEELRDAFVSYCLKRQTTAQLHSENRGSGHYQRKAEAEIAEAFRTTAEFWSLVKIGGTDDA